MGPAASPGRLLVYVLVAVAGMVFFWNARHQPGESYNIVLDVILPLIAVAICGYAIYSTLVPRPPAPISYSAWIALAWLGLGLLMVLGLVITRPDRVRTFGKAFDTSEH